MLSERKIRILNDIIHSYIDNARPVGSQAIVTNSKVDVSPATVRNEMLDLEQEGYVFQPHASAGRIPTEKAWHLYIDQYLEEKPVTKQQKAELQKILQAYRHSKNELYKHVAQMLSEYTQQVAVIGFTAHDTYYTGFSRLFSQPEFEELDFVRSVSAVVDHLDETMPVLFRNHGRDIDILIGSNNPFDKQCGLIVANIRNVHSLLGVLGPIRQDYGSHVGLLRYTKSLLENL